MLIVILYRWFGWRRRSIEGETKKLKKLRKLKALNITSVTCTRDGLHSFWCDVTRCAYRVSATQLDVRHVIEMGRWGVTSCWRHASDKWNMRGRKGTPPPKSDTDTTQTARSTINTFTRVNLTRVNLTRRETSRQSSTQVKAREKITKEENCLYIGPVSKSRAFQERNMPQCD